VSDIELHRSLAAKFRRLAEQADSATAELLLQLAADHEELAREKDPSAQPPMPTPE
jgi:hypothetical protein